MQVKSRFIAALFMSMGMASTATAELCERAGGAAYYDTVLDITWLADANFLATSGIHPNGQMPFGVAKTVWIPLLNDQNYLGINTWRIPKWFDMDAEHCDYNWDGGTDCGWNMHPMSSENWYNYSVNMGLKSQWASREDFLSEPPIEQHPWGADNHDTSPFFNVQAHYKARRYHNDNWCEDRVDENGDPDHAIGFHYEYGGQHCDGVGSTGHIWPVVDGDVVEGAGDMTTCGTEKFDIDVVPFDEANNIDPESTDDVSVALINMSMADGDYRDFDPTQVDPATLRFGPLESEVVSGTPLVIDVDGDADSDLVYQFNILDAGFVCEDTKAILVGETFTGEGVRGSDDIVTPECEDEGCHP